MTNTGTLHIVATPIGNLEDITYRAVRVLGEVDYVLCEDTRVTRKLLDRYDIQATLKRYDAHASEQTHSNIIADLQAGKSLALVSDAGTPGVSDPGVLLIRAARAAGAVVVAVPGPSAVTAAVSLAAIPGNQFTFLGFVPQKKGRQTFFKELPEHPQPVIFFDSTHRIMKTLAAMAELYPSQQLSIGRELTKLHEEFLTGTPAELTALLEAEPVKQKGEFVLISDTEIASKTKL